MGVRVAFLYIPGKSVVHGSLWDYVFLYYIPEVVALQILYLKCMFS